MLKKSKRPSAGFTLLELLVVIVIIGLLAAFVAPKYFGQIGKSKTQMARAQIEALDKAIDQYRLDTGTYPTTAQGLVALSAQPAGEANWRGPYLKKGIPMDPWGKPYIYTSPGADEREFDLASYGNDGATGGSNEDADVTNYGN
ncbi:type II secretion system major pseudopilin GspG [Massilia sp. CCM 9210]|uniref:type II secretion system major pseudopilin GspG n=1 Tax=Massilia scottii TaxID=3057166 RepID=UPI00279649AE|nr:type II secretion system major pseudopilin GspG [Massilia sp. CCM 9210]MDQ1813300.1 type II secretion system major pseudopilin GspG [Massilia sp. CCM 9210]